jgi:hypothetical protein
MTYHSDLQADLRAEQAACHDDAIMEEFSSLGVTRHMEIIRELRASGAQDGQDGVEGMEAWFLEMAKSYEFDAIEPFLEWLATEEAGDEERMEFLSCGYDLSRAEVVTRFCPQPDPSEFYGEI